VEGRLETNAFDDKKGNRKYYTQIVVNDLLMLDGKAN
jgi:single-stranded DNA-binding protein